MKFHLIKVFPFALILVLAGCDSDSRDLTDELPFIGGGYSDDSPHIEALGDQQPLNIERFAVEYHFLQNSIESLSFSEAARWARYLCTLVPDHDVDDTPLNDFQVATRQPSLYPDYEIELRSYVEQGYSRFLDRTDMQGYLEVSMDFGEYSNGILPLQFPNRRPSIRLLNDNPNFVLSGGLKPREVQSDRHIPMYQRDATSAMVRREECGDHGFRMPDLLGAENYLLRRETGTGVRASMLEPTPSLAIEITNYDEVERIFSGLALSSDDARALVEAGLTSVNAFISFDELEVLDKEPISRVEQRLTVTGRVSDYDEYMHYLPMRGRIHQVVFFAYVGADGYKVIQAVEF